MKPSVRELIPVLVIFVALTSAIALILEVLTAVVAGKPVDSAGAAALAAVLTACVPVLGALYRLDTREPPQTPKEEPKFHVDTESVEKSRRILDDYLDRIVPRRWRARST